jgi:RHS repeat-associated protein
MSFPGQYYDTETGLHYNYYRYYNPPTGRYLTADPIGLRGGINLFVYARNNPVKLIDPTGLFDPGGENAEFLGHGDFTGSDCFDYNLEDRGKTAPKLIGGHPAGHYQPLAQSEEQVRNAIASCNKEAFERAMHRGQDYFTHYAKDYRWDPGNRRVPCFGFGHACSGSSPDQDDAAWAKAESWTKGWVKEWFNKCKCCNPK